MSSKKETQDNRDIFEKALDLAPAGGAVVGAVLGRRLGRFAKKASVKALAKADADLKEAIKKFGRGSREANKAANARAYAAVTDRHPYVGSGMLWGGVGGSVAGFAARDRLGKKNRK